MSTSCDSITSSSVGGEYNYNKLFCYNYLLFLDTIYVPQYKSGEFDTLYGKFATMFSHVSKAIKGKALPLEDIKQHLEIFDSTLEAELAEIDTFQGVMRLIRKNCSLIHIKIIEAVVEHFDISEAQKYIDDYNIVIDKFCQELSVSLCLNEPFDVVKMGPPLKRETATFVFDWEPKKLKLKDVKDILSKTTGKLVKIQNINEGNSIIVTCTFPYSLTGSLIIEVMKNLETLKKNGLMKLTIGYCIVWSKVCMHVHVD